MYGHEFMVCEEFVPVHPWDEFEQRWFDSIRNAMKVIKDGKRHVDSRSNQEARGAKKKSRRKKG